MCESRGNVRDASFKGFAMRRVYELLFCPVMYVFGIDEMFKRDA